MPRLIILSGCNGAGKTTASYTFLPEILDCRDFVNSDEFAKSLSPFDPSSASVSAKVTGTSPGCIPTSSRWASKS